MKQIQITRLQLKNVAGITDLKTDFSNDVSISGSNGAGKTTIAHAISWLLTGKDLHGNSNWHIKPRDLNNEVLATTTSVECKVLVDNTASYTLAKTIEGTHDYSYFVNNVEYKRQDFYDHLEKFIAPVSLIQLMLTPHALHNVHWSQRRDFLISLAGNFCNADIANELGLSVESLVRQYSLEFAQKTVNARLRNSDQLLGEINNREAERNLDHNSTKFTEQRLQKLGEARAHALHKRAGNVQQHDELNRLIEEKVRLVEGRLAEIFEPVRWKMWERDSKGDHKQTCRALINGRDWPELSTGEKIKTGLQILQIMQQHYNIALPCIVDEHESAAHTDEWPMPNPRCQKIRLYHKPNKELSINY